MATCAVYGDGHYLTFDGQRYSFSGNCEYTLVQVRSPRPPAPRWSRSAARLGLPGLLSGR